jgi:hypothetical protein
MGEDGVVPEFLSEPWAETKSVQPCASVFGALVDGEETLLLVAARHDSVKAARLSVNPSILVCKSY